jgi:Spy/CpxP family protein refolding chaperone
MRRVFSISAVLLVLALISVPVLAQHQHGSGQAGKPEGQAQQHQRGTGHPVLGNLSEEQQEAMVALFAEHRKAMMQHSLHLRAKQAELNVLLAAPEFQQAQVDTVTAEIITLKGEAMKLRNELRRKVFEETGHLMRGSKGHGVAECGKMSGKMSGKKGRMGNCPMMSGHGVQSAE